MSYIESQVIGPLPDDTVTRMAVIGHLELEDIIATRSISVFIEQNTSTCTSCRTHGETNWSDGSHTERDRSHTERQMGHKQRERRVTYKETDRSQTERQIFESRSLKCKIVSL